MKKYHSWLDISAGKIISQPMQRVLCENFVKKINGKIVFELGEDVEFKSYQLQFRKMIKSKLNVNGFIFLGLGQFLFNGKVNISLVKEVIKSGYELHFVRENLSIKTFADFKKRLKELIIFCHIVGK